MINLRLDGTVQTLILTLRARADEQDQENPLLKDPWSADWYKFMPENTKLEDWYNPNFQLASVIRSTLIDEAVEAFIETHDNPLVIELGSGLSTRYFRTGEGKSRWIELDVDEAISARRKIDKSVENHWFIASDAAKDEWLSLLPEYDPKNTLIIAEAMLMFLEPDKVSQLFEMLAEHFNGATFIFDVVNPSYIDQANEQFEEIDAPMQWGIVEDDLSKYDLTVNDVGYLLLEYPDRWDAIGVDASKRTKERSGYVVAATLG